MDELNSDEFDETEVYSTNGPSRNGNPARMYPQRSYLSSTNSGGNVRKRKASIGIPTENYFTHTFEVLSSVKQEQLEKCYYECQGRLPSRIGLRTMSQELGLSQNRIRKWFYDRSRKKIEEARSFNSRNGHAFELENLLEEIQENWKCIGEIPRDI